MRFFTLCILCWLLCLSSIPAIAAPSCYLSSYTNLDRGLNGQPDYTGWTIPTGWLASKNTGCNKDTLRFSADTSTNCQGYSRRKSQAISPPFQGMEQNVVAIQHAWGWNQFDGAGQLAGGYLELKVSGVWYGVESGDFESGGYNQGTVKGASCGEDRGDRSVFGGISAAVWSRVNLDRVCLRVTGQPTCKGEELELGFTALADCQAGGIDNLGWSVYRVRLEQCEIEAGPGDFYFLPTPCRLLDTRTRPEGKIKAPGEWISTAGCGLPTLTQSLVLNVTTITPDSDGWYLLDVVEDRVYSVQHYYEKGKNRATGAQLIEVDNQGRGFYVRASGDVHIVLDVSGWTW